MTFWTPTKAYRRAATYPEITYITTTPGPSSKSMRYSTFLVPSSRRVASTSDSFDIYHHVASSASDTEYERRLPGDVHQLACSAPLIWPNLNGITHSGARQVKASSHRRVVRLSTEWRAGLGYKGKRVRSLSIKSLVQLCDRSLQPTTQVKVIKDPEECITGRVQSLRR